MKEHQIKKIISVWVIGCFLLSDLGLAQSGLSVADGAKTRTPTFMNIEIPYKLAKVEEIYEAPPKVDPSLVVHIQNAHGNYDAQLKTKNLLKHLYETYDFRLLFVEGAVDRIEPDLLRLYPTNEQNLEVADLLARDGKLTGTEFFMVDAPADIHAVGIENPELYRENYQAFQEVYKNKENVDKFLAKLSKRLVTLSSNHFSSDLRKLVLEWRMFEKGRRDFLPYIERLSKEAKDYLDLDLGSLSAQVAWPQLTRLLVLQSMEKDLDLEVGKKEKEEVLTYLRRNGASEELREAIDKIEERHIRVNRLEPKDKRKENLPRYVIERLIAEMGPKGFNFLDYPDFSLYVGYYSLKSEVDSRDLFLEIELLFQNILDSLAKTHEEKVLLDLFRDEMLLQKLFSLELTRENWDRFLRRKERLGLEKILDRIKEVDQQTSEIKISQSVADTYATAIRFYHLARQRESIFYYMVKQGMIQETAEKSALLTGGFHTMGVFERFREDEVNYGILMPQISGELSKEAYVTAMMETSRELFEPATVEAPLLMNVNPSLVGANALRLRLEAVSAAIMANTNNIRVIGEQGKALLNAYGLANQFSTSLFAKASGIQLVYDPSLELQDAEYVYVAQDGQFSTANDDRKNYYVYRIETAKHISYDEKGVMIQTIYHVLNPEVTTTTNAPNAAFRQDVYDNRIVREIKPSSAIQVPQDFLDSLDSEPAAEAEDPLTRYATARSSRDVVNLGEARKELTLGPDLLNLLLKVNFPELLAAAKGDETKRDEVLSLGSALTIFGFTDANNASEQPGVIAEIVNLADLSKTRLEKINDAILESAAGLVSAESGDVIFVRKTGLSDERIDAIAKQLAMNPNLRVYYVLGGDDEALSEQTATEIMKQLREKLTALDIPTANIENRLSISVVRNSREQEREIQRLSHRINQSHRKRNALAKENGETTDIGAAAFMLVAEDVVLKEADLSAIVVNSEELSTSQLDSTLQIAMGHASQILNSIDASPLLKGVLLKDFNSQLINLVYNVDEGGLSQMQSQVRALLQAFESTAKILQSA